ncbi:Phosphoglycolate phosphatase [Candidatus Xiphinematobacter sp. Idaho Grape]|uniref:HAD family hydrolase n=1 Tax=Candidatus Xiphinematobacter sp. Idaho Grape TaxID=1704307 RepID=UPI00070574E3|nr:haloacid dehalogenase-like hydrolase [Candidatus Xiphinematobacter sp. Idaho Grape]ALJ56932.1 Phosphoglycolate phosphatase [Candidatus Xiphinematobacter sp. Idaho Grape]
MQRVISSRRLFLFDIDGTLLTSAHAGKHALRDSMQSQFGIREDLTGIPLAGATDGAVAKALLAKNGIPVTQENTAFLLEGYLRHLSERIYYHPGNLMPGVLELLQYLSLRPDCVLGLLTGNLVRGAQIKLTFYGAWHFFEFGAFADDHDNRNELGNVARTRACKIYGIEFPPGHIYVVGDTPSDIDCGRAINAHTVAVATGEHSMEELSQFQPDFLFKDLLDTSSVLYSLLR